MSLLGLIEAYSLSSLKDTIGQQDIIGAMTDLLGGFDFIKLFQVYLLIQILVKQFLIE